MKDKILRNKFKKKELKIKQWKAITNNLIIPLTIRINGKCFQDLLPYFTKIRNICKLTHRKRGIIKKFGISRLQFRKLAEEGYLPGVRRASW